MFKKRQLKFLIIIMVFAFLIPYNCFAINNDSRNLPEKYDLRDLDRLTPVKEQGNIGSCWALTSIASLESFLLQQTNQTYDLSENNLITQLSDTYIDGFDRKPHYGGDDVISTAYYAGWRGPVLEKDDPYALSKMNKDIIVRPGKKVIKHVQGVQFIPERLDYEDNEHIKELIIKYGAISASMWKGTDQTFGRYYNEDTFSWYYPDENENKEGNGHAINIIGWDDNYSKDNFKITPPSNGAFIVRNTKGPLWGRLDSSKNMGGYFYISYYDGMLLKKRDSLQGGAVFTRVDEIDNYDNIYQYDILGYTKELKSTSNEVWFSNVFDIKQMNTEKLEAVSFYTLDDNLEYEIWYTGEYKGSSSFKRMKKVKNGYIDATGYHTIDLDIPLDINGNKIAVAIKLKSQKVKPKIAIESPKGFWSSKAHANKGESYIKTGSGNFKDLWNTEKNSNACLKIFTNNYIDEKDLLTIEAMKGDVDFTVKWIKDHQPIAKIIGYTKEQQDIIDQVYKSIEKPLSPLEFQLTIRRLFTMMGDGHTNLFRNGLTSNYLDIPFVWLDEGIVIDQDTDLYKVGDKILSIGGKTPDELNMLLYQQVSSENDYWIRDRSPNILSKEMYLRFFHLINDDNTVSIEIQRNDKKIIFRQEITPTREFYPLGQTKVDHEWFIEKKNNLGYFRFDSWPSKENAAPLIKEIDNFFEAVADNNITNIAFDIRYNTGGSMPAGNHIMSYLDLSTLYFDGYTEYSYHKNIPSKTEPLLFTGNTFFITSNRSFSCSVYALSLLHDNGEVYTIGEPTGENPAFNMHGNSADGTLPYTNWDFMMTSGIGSRAGELDLFEDAIYPDIPIYTTVDDLVNNRDPQLKRLREITRNNETLPILSKVVKPIGSGYNNNRKGRYILNHTFNPRNNDSIPKESTTTETRTTAISNGIIMKSTSSSYVTKFKYAILYFDTKLFCSEYGGSSLVYLTDSNGNKIDLLNLNTTDADSYALIIKPNLDLDKGSTYTIHVKPGAILDENGKYNSNYIKATLTVK